MAKLGAGKKSFFFPEIADVFKEQGKLFPYSPFFSMKVPCQESANSIEVCFPVMSSFFEVSNHSLDRCRNISNVFFAESHVGNENA